MMFWTGKYKNAHLMRLNHAENARALECPGKPASAAL